LSRTPAAFALAGICPLYLTQNDGTVMSADMAMALPVMSFASGATNSMRGAAFLRGQGRVQHRHRLSH
jgi:N-methylhydantoinase A/oxoprolinase/acetone carboxylase beta subunit